MKKIITLLLIFTLAFSFTAAGCGSGSSKEKEISSEKKHKDKDKKKDQKNDQNEVKTEEEPIITSTDAVEEIVASVEVVESVDISEAAMTAYQQFLDGSRKCEIAYQYANIQQGVQYDISGLLGWFAKFHYDDFLMPLTNTKVLYGYMDCGIDGVNELALDVVFTYDDGVYGPEEYEVYFVIGYDGSEIKLIDVENSYYRVATDLSATGYVVTGGSSGANVCDYTVSCITGDCRKVLLYKEEDIYEEEEPYISYYNISSLVRPDDYPDYEPAYQGYYMFPNSADPNMTYIIRTINFEESPYYGTDEYESYLQKNLFFVSDDNDNSIELPWEYSNYYASMGLNIYGYDEMQTMIYNHVYEIGINPDWLTYVPIEWNYLFG